MNSLKMAAKNAVYTCMHIEPSERIFIATDKAQSNIAYSIEREAKKAVGTSGVVEKYIIEDYFPKDFLSGQKKPDNVQLPSTMLKSLKLSNAAFWIDSGTFPIELNSKVEEIATKDKRRRYAQMSGLNEQAFIEGMSVDYKEVKRFTDRLYDVVSIAKEIHISNEQGTSLNVKLNPKYKWVKDSGIADKEADFFELPDGELGTTPEEVNGTVYTNLFGDTFDARYGYLPSPVRFEIEKGRLRKDKIKCCDEKLRKDLIEYVGRYEDGDRVGEISLPTNLGLMRKEIKSKDKILLVEKANVHGAFGAPPDDRIEADWPTIDTLKSHIDWIILKSNVILDGKETIMEKGHYIRQLF